MIKSLLSKQIILDGKILEDLYLKRKDLKVILQLKSED
jgi:hypothetical protein